MTTQGMLRLTLLDTSSSVSWGVMPDLYATGQTYRLANSCDQILFLHFAPLSYSPTHFLFELGRWFYGRLAASIHPARREARRSVRLDLVAKRQN